MPIVIIPRANRPKLDFFLSQPAAPNGKYLSVDGELKISADHDGGTPFLIQLCKNSRLALKPAEPAGAGYVTSDHVGYMTASGKSVDKSTLWEY